MLKNILVDISSLNGTHWNQEQPFVDKISVNDDFLSLQPESDDSLSPFSD
jgi:hypothetical protein